MGILGISIQSHTGLPLYLESWSKKLRAFRDGDPILIAGFLSALSSLASNYRQRIGYIRFFPVDFPDPYGIDGIYSFIGEYMIFCFTDSYQFHPQVHLKIKWIYQKVLFKYEKMIQIGKVPILNEEDKKYIYDILLDSFAFDYISNKREVLNRSISDLISKEYPNDVFGCFITSFDNSLLFKYGMDRNEIEIYMNNIKIKVHNLSNGEILHNYVTLPGLEPRLVVMTNSGVKLQIADILEEGIEERSVPLYFYVIINANCAIEPIVESLVKKFNIILV
ncbi:MAG: hypothetical protein ACFFD2_04955 [Promethearchaeota archaeon]